jgi:REP element-mobilizing transposase RayT
MARIERKAGASVDAASSRVPSVDGGKRESSQSGQKRPEAASTGAAVDAASGDLFSLVEFDPHGSIGKLKGNLPHWRQEGVTYFVTFRLADSIPQERLAQWLAEREAWLARHPAPLSEKDRQEYGRLFPERIETWLDADHGSCVLARPDCRRIVEDTLRHFAGRRYLLDEFVVMPNHVHVLVTPLGERWLSGILHTWKSFTSHQVNRVTGRRGILWQKESFDHIVRNATSLEKFRQYIRDNPKPLLA